MRVLIILKWGYGCKFFYLVLYQIREIFYKKRRGIWKRKTRSLGGIKPLGAQGSLREISLGELFCNSRGKFLERIL